MLEHQQGNEKANFFLLFKESSLDLSASITQQKLEWNEAEWCSSSFSSGYFFAPAWGECKRNAVMRMKIFIIIEWIEMEKEKLVDSVDDEGWRMEVSL